MHRLHPIILTGLLAACGTTESISGGPYTDAGTDTRIDTVPDTAPDTPADPGTDLPPGACGAGGGECPPGRFCELLPGCDPSVPGACVELGDGDCTMVYAPQCGCDGITYGNACMRRYSGESMLHPGECGPNCGPDGLPSCDDGSFCEWPSGSCGEWGVGECMPVPEGCFDYEDPVCGCDGSTYSNDCYRQRAGVSLLHHGPC